MKQLNKKVDSGKVYEATPLSTAQTNSIPKWNFTIISTGMIPTEAELAQWRALPGVPLACAAFSRYLRDARLQDSTNPTADAITKLPKKKSA